MAEKRKAKGVSIFGNNEYSAYYTWNVRPDTAWLACSTPFHIVIGVVYALFI